MRSSSAAKVQKNIMPNSLFFLEVLPDFSSNNHGMEAHQVDDWMKKQEVTAAQKRAFERLQDARACLTLSPNARYEAKVKLTLRLIHGWGQTTTKILKRAIRCSSSDWLTSMVENGWIRSVKVYGRYFWLMTQLGLDHLRLICPKDELLQLQATRRINLLNFEHNRKAQEVLANKMYLGGAGCEIFVERQLSSLTMSEPGAKIPDGAFRDSCGAMTYIEIERSKKKQPELESMLLALARLIEDKPNANVEIFIDPHLHDRYKSTLGGWLASGKFRAWSKSTAGDLFQQGIYQSTATLVNAMRRISFIPCVIGPHT